MAATGPADATPTLESHDCPPPAGPFAMVAQPPADSGKPMTKKKRRTDAGAKEGGAVIVMRQGGPAHAPAPEPGTTEARPRMPPREGAD